jgi:chemotaxis protein MotA
LLGLGAVFVFVLLVLFNRGGTFYALFDFRAFLMVVGGTVTASAFSFPTSTLVSSPRLFLLAVFGENMHMPTVVAQLVKASDRVRMSGRAAAVGAPRDVDDAFMKTGLQFVAEGLDPQEIRALLDSELSAIRSRHRMGIGLYESLGGFSPTFGILGTVEAMISILGNLTSPDKLGPEIALAMVATLYGVGFANLLFVPVATRLRKLSEEELRGRQLILEVIVAIQEGAKPEFIRERLRVSLPPETRRTIAALSERKAKKNRKTAQMEPPPMHDYGEEMVGSVPMDGDLY